MERFNDPNAADNPALVHTVEVSTEAGGPHFFTLWVKGGTKGELGDAAKWAKAAGLKSYHDTDVFHQGEGNYGWLPKVYPGKETQGWGRHYHVVLAAPACWADFAPYLDQIPEALQDAVYALVGPLRHPAAQTPDLTTEAPDGAEAGPDDGIVWHPGPDDVVDILPMVPGPQEADCGATPEGGPETAVDAPKPKRKRKGRRKVDPLEQPDEGDAE